MSKKVIKIDEQEFFEKISSFKNGNEIIRSFNNYFKKIEKQEMAIVHFIYLSSRILDKIVHIMGDDLDSYMDLIDEKTILETGVYATLWTADIIVKDDIDSVIFSPFCKEDEESENIFEPEYDSGCNYEDIEYDTGCNYEN